MIRTFPVSAGLLEHKQRMGATVWEYMWLLDHITSDEPDGDGKFSGVVQYGTPIDAEIVARALKESIDTAKTNLRKLEVAGYVSRQRVVGAGYSYIVINSKKWIWKRSNSHRGENPSMGNLPDSGKKPVDHRVENPSNNKECKTPLRHTKRKPSSPDGEMDSRHSLLRAEIQRLWLLSNPGKPAAPWNGRTATALQRILKDNPAWMSDLLKECVANRFASEVNHAEDPVFWIPRLISYANGPLNQFNKPKGIRNGNANETGNRAERRQAENIAAGAEAVAILHKRMAH
jgi:hypothetical protein